MGETIAVLGSLSGLVIWGMAGTIAAKAAYDAAANEEQRRALRQLFWVGGPYAAVLMALVVLVGIRGLPSLFYVVAFCCWFGALLPGLAWAHHRLEEAGAESPEPLRAI